MLKGDGSSAKPAKQAAKKDRATELGKKGYVKCNNWTIESCQSNCKSCVDLRIENDSDKLESKDSLDKDSDNVLDVDQMLEEELLVAEEFAANHGDDSQEEDEGKTSSDKSSDKKADKKDDKKEKKDDKKAEKKDDKKAEKKDDKKAEKKDDKKDDKKADKKDGKKADKKDDKKGDVKIPKNKEESPVKTNKLNESVSQKVSISRKSKTGNTKRKLNVNKERFTNTHMKRTVVKKKAVKDKVGEIYVAFIKKNKKLFQDSKAEITKNCVGIMNKERSKLTFKQRQQKIRQCCEPKLRKLYNKFVDKVEENIKTGAIKNRKKVFHQHIRMRAKKLCKNKVSESTARIYLNYKPRNCFINADGKVWN